MNPDPEQLADAVSRIVDGVHPLRIILFGSAARGEMSEGSDLDLLVIVPDGTDCRATAKKLYRVLRGLEYAKDILVFQQSDVQQQRDNPYLVVHRALAEGRELYRAA